MSTVSVLAIGAALMFAVSGAPVSAASAAARPASKSASSSRPKPFNASKLLAGNAKPKFPAGASGKVSVVAQSSLQTEAGLDSGTLLVAYRNNTKAAISHVDFSVTATVGHKIVASGQSQGGAIPAQTQPGEVALDYIYFENVKSVPKKGVKYSFSVDTMPADTSSFNTAPLKVTQASNNGSAIIGTAVNKTGHELQGPYGVYAYCLHGDHLVGQVQDFAHPDGDLAAGAQASFSIGLYDTKCKKFAVGVSGYFK